MPRRVDRGRILGRELALGQPDSDPSRSAPRWRSTLRRVLLVRERRALAESASAARTERRSSCRSYKCLCRSGSPHGVRGTPVHPPNAGDAATPAGDRTECDSHSDSVVSPCRRKIISPLQHKLQPRGFPEFSGRRSEPTGSIGARIPVFRARGGTHASDDCQSPLGSCRATREGARRLAPRPVGRRGVRTRTRRLLAKRGYAGAGGSGRRCEDAGRVRLRRLGPVPRRRRLVAILVARTNRQDNVDALEVAWTYPTGENYSFNPLDRRQHDVRAREGPLYRRARRGDAAASFGRIRTKAPVGTRGMNYWRSTDGSGRAPALHQRRPPDGDRREDRRVDRDVRRRRPRRPAHRSRRSTSPDDSRAADQQPGPHLRRPDHHVAARRRRGLRVVTRRHSRVQRSHRRSAVDFPHRSAPRGVRRRNVARRRLEQLRRRAQLERIDRRRRDRHRSTSRPARRATTSTAEPPRRQPVRQQFARARCTQRQAAVALPDDPSRSLGLRSADGAEAAHRACTTACRSPIVAQPSKQGFVYVFNRVTGAPLWPIEERPVPQSDVPGEMSWPTQPFPTAPPPFARQSFTEKDINPHISAEDQAKVRELLRTSRNEGLYTPPSLHGTIMMPGHNGGANWGSSAVDPKNGRLFVVSKELPTYGESPRARRPPAPARGPRRPASRSTAARQPPAAATAAERGPGLHPVRRSGRLHDSAEHGAVRDRTAVVAAHGLRLERRHDPLADPERRSDARSLRPPARAATRRAAESSQRAAGCCSSALRPTASSARMTPTRARCSGATTCPRRRKACPPSTRSGGKQYVAIAVGGNGLFSQNMQLPPAGPGAYMVFALDGTAQ